jgi:hypothetical protein
MAGYSSSHEEEKVIIMIIIIFPSFSKEGCPPPDIYRDGGWGGLVDFIINPYNVLKIRIFIAYE